MCVIKFEVNILLYIVKTKIKPLFLGNSINSENRLNIFPANNLDAATAILDDLS